MMQIKLYTVPLFGGEQIMEEMNRFLRGNKVVDITKQLITHGDVSFWSFCIVHLQNNAPQQQPDQKQKVDYKTVLTAEEFARFQRMREIRKALAEADSVPAYAVFLDSELAEFARMTELTTASMQKVQGVGEKRTEKYGNSFCTMYNQPNKQE